jgi:hypothetical protein
MLSKGLFDIVSFLGDRQLCLHRREMVDGGSVWITDLLSCHDHPLPQIEDLFDQLDGAAFSRIYH